jgi:long-chain acyl-CoA synthetase
MEKHTENTIYPTFANTAERCKHDTAVVYLGTRFSYQELRDKASRFALALTDMGLTGGQKIIIYIPNGIQWVVAWLGIQKIGGICVCRHQFWLCHQRAAGNETQKGDRDQDG